MASPRPAAAQWLSRVPLLMPLLLACLSLGAGTDAGADVSEYEYLYDVPPREHLARFGRSLGEPEHVQHVPAHAPRAPEDADSVVQRVPRVPRRALPAPASALQEDAAPQTAAPEAGPQRPDQPAALGDMSGEHEQDHDDRPQVPEPATELKPPARVEGAAENVQTEQAPQVPAAIPDDSLVKEDMETANFFWGLGPVYPHLYVYRRVPHLVPLHGWNPYHAYLITHPSS